MKRITAFIAALTLITGVLSGCSSAPANTSSQDSQPESTPAVTQAETTAEEPEAAAWPRTIVDATGAEIVLERQPERVTLLHIVYMEHFLLLDSPPKAAAIGNAQGATEALSASEMFAPYFEDSDMIVLGSSKDLSLEAVLESAPDVIVTFFNAANAETVAQLAEIAPVVQISYADTWQDQLMLCASVLGKETEAEKIIADTEKATADAKEALSAHTDRSFALFRTDGKSFIAQGMANYYGVFGLTRPEGFPDKAESLSLEAVAEMNPYYIVFQHNQEVAKTFVESVESSSVWQSLDAVKAGRVYYWDENMNSYGPLALQLASEKLTALYSE